jgi:hypothetical protein
MFATFRKHQKLLYGLALAVIIPSFVVFFSPEIGRNSGDGEVNLGVVDGKPVSRSEYNQARREVALRYRLFMGSWPDSARMARFNQNLNQETLQRAALIRRIEAQGIHAGDEAVVEQIRTYFRSPEGRYEPASYQNTLKMLATEAGVTEQEFVNFVRHELGIRHLGEVHGLAGKLVTPRIAEDAYRREHEQLLTAGVFFHASNYVGKVEIKTNDLAQFYTNQLPRYRVPVRVQVHYAAFEAINYLTEAAKQLAQNTNLTAAIDLEYERRGTNSFTNAVGKVLSPEEAKETIKEEQRKMLALNAARLDARRFANVVFEKDQPTVADFLAAAAAQKITVKATEPFTIADGPKDLKVSPGFASAAFEFIKPNAVPVSSKAIVGEDAVYLLAFKQQHEGYNPPMETVLEKVTEDYRRQESLNLMSKAAREARTALTNAMAGGKSFVDAAKEAKLEAVTFPALVRNPRPVPELEKLLANSFMFQRHAWETPTGQTSEPMSAGDTAFIVHVLARQPAPADKLAAELPSILENLRESWQGYAINDWMSRQAQSVQVPVDEDEAKKEKQK